MPSPRWLPGGKMITSAEYACGGLTGGAGQSLRVNVTTGVWCDFATNEKGADLIDLYAAIHRLRLPEAAKELAQQIGFGDSSPRQLPPAPAPKPQSGVRPPDCVKPPSFSHAKFGKPSRVWTYRFPDGGL